jgi:hypothetical protein
LTRLEFGEFSQSLIQQQQLALARDGCVGFSAKRDLNGSAGPFRSEMLARVIDKDAPHHLRRNDEELPAILPRQPILPREPQVGFMNQRRRLKGVILPLLPEVRAGSSPKLAVNQRDQIIARLDVSPSPGLQQPTNVAGFA